MYARLASYAALAAAAAWGGWTIQGQRMGAQLSQLQTEYAQAQQQAVEKAHAQTIRLQEQADKAARQSAARQAALAHDVAAGRSALVGLSNAADAALRAAQDSHSACLVKADAFADVFQQCRVRLREVGEAADGHASDVQTLIDVRPN